MGTGRVAVAFLLAGVLAGRALGISDLPPLPAASHPPSSYAASTMDPASISRLLARRGGIKIRAEPVIESEASRIRVSSLLDAGKGGTDHLLAT